MSTWEFIAPRPHPGLRGTVVAHHGYRLRKPAPLSHLALPVPIIPMILSFGAIHTMTSPTGVVSAASFTAGLTDRPVRVCAPEYHGLQIDMTPLGASRILGVPAGQLSRGLYDLTDIAGNDGERLIERLADADSWRHRFQIVESFLLNRLTASPPPAPALTEAWRRLATSHGQIRVGQLASDLNWSVRHLGNQFSRHIGLSPKQAARIFRFDRAYSLLTSPGAPPLATVAVEAGYYDQAHLGNDVRELSGLTPEQLRFQHRADGNDLFAPA